MDGQTIREIVTGTLTHDFLRYVIGAGGVYLLINVGLIRWLAARQIRSERPGWRQMRREILVSMRTVLVFAATGVTIGFGATLGWLPVYDRVSEFGWGWFWVSTAGAILAQDAWFYWTHWLMHRPRLYRLMHRTHHKSHNPTPFTSYSFDTAEAAVHAVFLLLFIAVVPMHPTALFLFAVHMMFRNVIGHCGIELFPARKDGRPLIDWMTTVTHHDQHHANARYNLGLYFTWWDRWMGTEHPGYHEAFSRVAGPRRHQTRRTMAGLIIAALAIFPAAQARAEPLNGTYASPGLWIVIRFGPCVTTPETFCGRLVWAWDPSALSHADIGDTIVWGLTPSDGVWTGGKLRHPGTGWEFKGAVRRTVSGDLILKGCAGPICRNQRWQRVAPLIRRLKSIR